MSDFAHLEIHKTTGSGIQIWNDKRIVVLRFLNISHLSVIPDRSCESPLLKNWMYELCMFSQMWSHISLSRGVNIVCVNGRCAEGSVLNPASFTIYINDFTLAICLRLLFLCRQHKIYTTISAERNNWIFGLFIRNGDIQMFSSK